MTSLATSPLAQAWEAACASVVSSRPLPDWDYAGDPVGWAVDILGIPEESIRWSMNEGYESHVWDGTPDPFVAVAEALARGENVGVESGVGTGKTFTNGWLALWFLVCFPDSLVITTAPIKDQLTAQLWKEIGTHWPKFSKAYPKAETVQLRVRLKPGTAESERWAVIGYACGVDAASASAIRAQGFHAPHMLVITEETPGIDPAIMTALRNTAVGEHNIQLSVGNPDHQLDALHTYCLKDDVTHVIISALDHPNVVLGRDVIPGAQSRKGLKTLANDWEEGTPMYESRVRGISPSESVDALIKLEWCETAAAKYKDPKYRTGRRALGVDVAQSLNGDKAALALGEGACLLEVKAFQCPNATTLGTNVVGMMGLQDILPHHVGIDPIGVGAATLNEIRRNPEHASARALGGSMLPVKRGTKNEDGQLMEWLPDSNLFNNLRSQMWWQLREDLRLGRLALPNDKELLRELTTPTYTTQNGKAVVEAKEQIKKRLAGHSPDKADAVVYWNWVRPRALVPTTDDEVFKEDRHPGIDIKRRERKVEQNPYDRKYGHLTNTWRTPGFRRNGTEDE